MFRHEEDNTREATLLHYLRILKKRQLTVLLFSGILLATVAIGTLIATPYYEAIATIEISPTAPSVMDSNSLADIVSLSAADERRTYYATQYRIMQSRTVLEETVRRLREEHGVTDFDEDERPYETLKIHLDLDPELDTRLVHVVFEYPDPEKAVLFANTLAEAYMDLNLQRALGTAQKAFTWLVEQQEVYRQRKYESDQRVHNFKFENELEAYEATQKSFDDLQNVFSETRAERVQLEAVYDRIKVIARSEQWSGLANHLSEENAVLQSLLRDLRTAEQEQNALAARYLPDHPKMLHADLEFDGLKAQVRAQVAQMQDGRMAQLKLIRDQESAIKTEISKVDSQLKTLDKAQIELDFLQAAADKHEGLFTSLDQRMSEADLAKVVQSNNVWFIDRAVTSTDPVRPKLATNLPMALLIGLLGGVALAFFMEYVDSTIKSREDLEEIVGIPFLGAIPNLSTSELNRVESQVDRALYVHAQSRSTAAEALRSVRTNILFRTPDRPQKRLLVASAVPREGKSFITSNLSAIIAMTGSRVLVIDADLRRPTQHKLFQMPNKVGLSSVLVGDATLAESIQRTHIKDLDLLTSGPRPPNPAELLGSESMVRLLDSITNYEFIIVDSSPIGAVADPLILSRFVDGVLMVIESNKTNRDHVLQCRSRMDEVKANVLGAVVNKLDVRRSGYGYYYYYDYNSTYGEPPEERQTG